MESNNLLIGLGGTGYDILIKIKEKIFEQTGKATHSEIEYVYIDSDTANRNTPYNVKDANGENQDINFSNNEFVLIDQGADSMPNFIEGQEEVKQFANEHGKRYREYVGGAFPKNGAGQKRMVGKLYLARKYDEVCRALNNALGNLDSIANTRQTATGNPNEEFNVFVFGSLGGGTGSGTCIDIPFILQSNPAYHGRLHIWGFFSEGNFYEDKPNTDYVKPNTYGALSELEYWSLNYNDKDSPFFPYKANLPLNHYYEQIFLMQKNLRATNISYDEMVDACAMATVALVHENTLSTLSNASQRPFTMERKERILSGFGVSDIVLNRDKVIQDYVSKKFLNLQLEHFSAGFDESWVSRKIDSFIRDNKLDEGVGDRAGDINQLIERLCPLYDYGTIDNEIKSIRFRTIETSEDADSDILRAKDDYMSRLTVAIGVVINKNDDIATIIQSLQVLKQDFFKEKGGLGITKSFFRSIGRQFTAMKEELQTEVDTHRENITIINRELNTLRQELPNQKKWYGKIDKNRQQNIIDNYVKKCNYLHSESYKSLAKETIEQIRKEKAIQYYTALLDEIERVYKEGNENERSRGLLVELDREIKGLTDRFSMSIRQLESSTNMYHQWSVIVDPVFIKNLKQEIKKVGFDTIMLDTANLVDDVSNNDNTELEIKWITDIARKLRDKYVGGSDDGSLLWAMFNSSVYTLERMLVKYINQTDLRKIFNIVQVNNRFLWNYRNMMVETDSEETKGTEELLVVFHKDMNRIIEENNLPETEYIFNNPSATYANLLGRFAQQQAINYVDNNNPDIITFYMQESAIPMFKINNIDSYADVFNKRISSEKFNYYTDNRIYALGHIVHPVKDNDAMRWWVWANVLEIVKCSTKGYEVFSAETNDYISLVEGTQGKKDRKKAYDAFAQNEEFIIAVEKEQERKEKNNRDKLKEELIAYLNERLYDAINLGKKPERLSEAEESIVRAEQEKIVQVAVYDFHIGEKELESEYLTSRQISTILDRNE